MPATVVVKPGHEKPLRRRHPWLFSGAVLRIDSDAGTPEPGEVAVCRDADGNFLAWGTVNPKARIVLRALSFREDEPPDAGLVRRRIAAAIARRLPLVPHATNAYRLVHAEADGLPGLVVDRYAGVLAVQITTAGMLRLENEIAEALATELSPQAIYAKTPRRPAMEEGIPQGGRALLGETPKEPIPFTEHGVSFLADVVGGQKTGFFLDQRDHRARVRELAGGRRVLDAYAYTGGFGVYAALGGAAQVTLVESSEPASLLARRHFEANRIPDDRYRIVRGDAPRFLRDPAQGPFDLVVLDPPPLAPGGGAAAAASRAYKDINLHAFRRLAPGGLLVTFSCSQAVTADLFGKIIFGAALDAGVEARILAHLGPPFDHPVSVYHPEGEYLCGLLVQVGG